MPGAATPYGAGDRDIVVVHYPVEWLRDINIVDTPGTNAVIRKHEQITSEFVPRADLILFVTSADRPFTESERAVHREDPRLGQKGRLRRQQDRHPRRWQTSRTCLGFVKENAQRLLGREPIVFGVSSRQARQAKNSLDADERTRLWAASRFEALERYILETLDEQERLRLKLANPLGVAQRLVEKYLRVAEARRELLKGRRADRPHDRRRSWARTKATCAASSSTTSATWTTCCTGWRSAGTTSSTRRSASSASST